MIPVIFYYWYLFKEVRTISKITHKMISRILADQVIESDSKQFVTIEEKSIINSLSILDDKLMYNGVGIGLPQLKEVKTTVQLGALESKTLSVDVGFNKYDIRTLEFTSDSTKAVVSIFDKNEDGFQVYKSIAAYKVYDVVNIPCEDKDDTNKLHISISNTDSAQTNVTVAIKVTSLL